MNYKITFSARFHYRQGSGVGRHYHPDYQIQLIYSGSAITHLNENCIALGPGDILFLKKGSYHDFTVNAKEGMKTLEIKFLSTDPDMDQFLDTIKPLFRDNDRQLFNIFSRIVLEGQRKSIFYRQMSESLLMESLITMQRICVAQDAPVFETDSAKARPPKESVSQLIESVDDYIARNINNNFTLAEMAESIGYNQDYLYRTIKKEIGISAVQYINRIKFERAKQLIQHTELSLTELSWNLGFDNLQYFSRFFRKYANISPSEYSAKVRASIRTDY
ncbi:AraC family transcriptional regulator [uncultured Sphaerochaeta sp.]|uniref:AraC family transcriptional regulator n=1 Tax=uncultured Sphaerochaeta sp. TaxID=886478 RepID=UPI002A0A3A20|nr:AraC family transcriptional regulator [uncultured Sphaerochaeta sp.]